MATITTTRGRYAILGAYFRAQAGVTPSGFFMALITAAGAGTLLAPVAPNPSNSQVWADLSDNEVPAGNGYTLGGISIARNSTDFDTFTEDTNNNRSFVGLKNLVWTASGGSLPSSGLGAAYAVLMDNTVDKNILAVFDLGGNRVVSNSQQLILQGFEYALEN